LIGKLSNNSLPFVVANIKIIAKMAGKIPINIILGGKEFKPVL
jgi:hypothetical protein